MEIRLDNLSIGYKKGKVVAADINAEFAAGQLSCLIGRNGTGKSTLLKTITGFITPKAGKVFVGGKDIQSMTQRERSASVSVVLTGAPEVHNLTVSEMVSLGRSPHTGFWGSLRDEDKRIVDDSMALTGISPLAGRMIQNLSDGERQKVMIARAIAQQTPAILLDEPTAFLDYPSKVDLMKLLQDLAHEQGKIIIMSTHDLELCIRFADSLFLVADGTLLSVDPDTVKTYIAQS